MTVPTAVPGRRRIPVVGAALLALLTSVAACEVPALVKASQAGAATHTGPITIGYAPLNQTSQILLSLGAGLKAYATTKGANVIVSDPANDATRQVQQLTDWVEHRRVQAIWAIAVDAASLMPVFDQARANGIAVLATGTPDDFGQANLTASMSYSFIDYTGWGADVGRVLGECANDRLKGRARVLYLHNPTGTVGSTRFGDGLRKGLDSTAPRSTITAVVDNEVSQRRSRQATQAALLDDSDINAVVGANDDALIGAVDGLTRSGRDTEQSCVVGAGGGKEALARVKSGDLYAVSALQYEQDITQNVDQMLQMVADPQAVGLQLLTPIRTVRS